MTTDKSELGADRRWGAETGISKKTARCAPAEKSIASPRRKPGRKFTTVGESSLRTGIRWDASEGHFPAELANCASNWLALSAAAIRVPSENTSVGVPLIPFLRPSSASSPTGLLQSPLTVGEVPRSM